MIVSLNWWAGHRQILSEALEAFIFLCLFQRRYIADLMVNLCGVQFPMDYCYWCEFTELLQGDWSLWSVVSPLLRCPTCALGPAGAAGTYQKMKAEGSKLEEPCEHLLLLCIVGCVSWCISMALQRVQDIVHGIAIMLHDSSFQQSDNGSSCCLIVGPWRITHCQKIRLHLHSVHILKASGRR